MWTIADREEHLWKEPRLRGRPDRQIWALSHVQRNHADRHFEERGGEHSRYDRQAAGHAPSAGYRVGLVARSRWIRGVCMRWRGRSGLSDPRSYAPTEQEVGHILLRLPSDSGESDEGDRSGQVRVT